MKLILCFLILGLQNPVPSTGKNSHPPQDQSKDKQSNSAPTNTPAAIPAPVTNLSSPARQQRGNDATDNCDSNAPKDGWGSPGILVSIVAVCVGVAQFIMYWKQWGIMRLTLKQTTSASKAAIKQARDSSERGLRAYVSASPGKVTEIRIVNEKGNIVGFDYRYEVHIKNGGQTPAYNITSSFEWDYFEPSDATWPNKKPFVIRFSTISDNSSVTIGAAEEAELHGVLKDYRDGLCLADTYKRWRKKMGVLFIFGEVQYEDIFHREKRTSKFCHRFIQRDLGEVTCTVYELHNSAT